MVIPLLDAVALERRGVMLHSECQVETNGFAKPFQAISAGSSVWRIAV